MSMRLKRTGSNSSLASLSSRSSQMIHVPEARGADFLDESEVRDRKAFIAAPMDTKRFKSISQNVQKHEVIPQEVRNKRYNRHMDVLPNPATRVQLPAINNDVTTSYVNANYIHGPDGNSKAYICAMGPLPASLKNWWRMIWKEKVTCILMATGLTEKGNKKCERYWAPRPGQKVKVADMFVRTLALSQGEGYVRTLLEIEHNSGQSRKVMHFWYNTWPDHGVPRTEDGRADAGNLLYMIRDSKRSEAELNQGGPVLTHCSAGVGRSGTIIALDFACQLLENTGKVDLNQVVEEIRQDRVALVQHPAQYELAFEGMRLYAQFVQTSFNTDRGCINAGFNYSSGANGHANGTVEEDVYGNANAADDEDAFNGDEREEASPDMANNNNNNAAPAAAAESPYGTAVKADPTAASPEPKVDTNVYGTAVAPTAASPAPAPASPTPAADPAPTTQPEYSVMNGATPVATEQPSYENTPAPEPTPAAEPASTAPEPVPVAATEVVYGDEQEAKPASPPPAKQSPVPETQPVVIRAQEPKPAPKEEEEDDEEDDDDEQFGFDAAAEGNINAEDFVNSKGKVVKKQVKAAIKGTNKEIAKLQQELAASEAEVQKKRREVTDQELLVQACQQRVDNKQAQVDDLKRRVIAASGSTQAADDEARSEVNAKRAEALVKAIGVMYTPVSANRHAKFMAMALQPHKARQAASLVGRRPVRDRSTCALLLIACGPVALQCDRGLRNWNLTFLHQSCTRRLLVISKHSWMLPTWHKMKPSCSAWSQPCAPQSKLRTSVVPRPHVHS
eukprot:TRINITY_DN8366_c0_g1_i8.p1 TRINITY_DN8366_c0_g1~~TRINITY_DN8366_c0_g1_i8.p1  ORF type:complete len:791 (+),score=208.37 TRINITY_DN8366_c0_g1_i8:215-2587(+)